MSHKQWDHFLRTYKKTFPGLDGRIAIRNASEQYQNAKNSIKGKRKSIVNVWKQQGGANGKNWWDNCAEPASYVTLMEWDDPDTDWVKIYQENRLGMKPQCYDRENLIRFMKENVFADWVQNPEANPMDRSGYGGKPGKKRFYKMFLGEFLDKQGWQRLKQKRIHEYILKPVIKNQRIGNLQGTFGIGQHHGQLPGFQIYTLVPKNEKDVYFKDKIHIIRVWNFLWHIVSLLEDEYYNVIDSRHEEYLPLVHEIYNDVDVLRELIISMTGIERWKVLNFIHKFIKHNPDFERKAIKAASEFIKGLINKNSTPSEIFDTWVGHDLLTKAIAFAKDRKIDKEELKSLEQLKRELMKRMSGGARRKGHRRV